MKRLFFTLFLAGLIACITCIAGTSDVYALSDQAIMDRLDELQRSAEKQQQEIRHLKQQLEEQKAAVKEATEVATKEAKEEVKLPGWVKRIKITGDVRTRYEGRYDLKSKGEELKDRNRGRLRARLYFDGKISDRLCQHKEFRPYPQLWRIQAKMAARLKIRRRKIQAEFPSHRHPVGS